MLTYVYRFLIELTNNRFVSNALKKFAQSKYSSFIIPSFASTYKINQDEMEGTLDNYNTLHSFFIRKLKEGNRPVDQSLDSIVSPVDAVFEKHGLITEKNIIEVKAKPYSAREMLGDDNALQKYIGGTFVLLYLSPSHYHRIHSPTTGVITNQWTLGTKSYPVNKLGLKYGKDPLSKNYRTITEVKQPGGQHMAIVKVGAMFVNSIETTHKNEALSKGEEIAYFTFGSTVVLLFEKNSFQPLATLKEGTEVKVGEKIGTIKEQ
ncbi:phosphatidylserine decarboxylase [Bacillus luteolus]|uniref:Phosphatidylserine decarboxylase proenzyme n=1 Tax=Litchfieldia luteola TaxID=682179 RepID=A0ABR9QHT6_9BACI|nr:phosphatidylserine decarboxylase [Cytobacillus luteolus]MBE4908061.1 phosphatidylserine decarboxylase [Cytobacillus luteolus]MBP1942844.1 phosphatidylserine decarboxylase [Cytobacillus luteolus]